jgi:hypothetical protein
MLGSIFDIFAESERRVGSSAAATDAPRSDAIAGISVMGMERS